MLSRAAARSISASRSLATGRSLSTAAGTVTARGLAATTTTLSQQRRELSGRAADRIDTDRVSALRCIWRRRACSRTRPQPPFSTWVVEWSQQGAFCPARCGWRASPMRNMRPSDSQWPSTAVPRKPSPDFCTPSPRRRRSSATCVSLAQPTSLQVCLATQELET